jgi:hypothetical protein
MKSGFLMIVPIYAKISKNKIKTFNAYTLPKVHQLGSITKNYQALNRDICIAQEKYLKIRKIRS